MNPTGRQRSIHLLRHAKAVAHGSTPTDAERPLEPRGHQAAAKMAAHIASSGVRPALVLCSPAQRTRQTLEGVIGALGDVEVRYEDGVYDALDTELLQLMNRLDPEIDSVMLVGHNPGITNLAVRLAGSGEAEAMERLSTEGLKTGALATLAFESEWATLGFGDAYLTSLVAPSML